MDEQVLTLRGLARLARRRASLVIPIILIGIAAGVGYQLAAPALTTAKSLVLLPASATNSSGQPAQDPETDVQIALSPAILVPSATASGMNLPYRQLQRRVKVAALTTDVLEITALARTSTRAEELANNTASHLVSYLNSSSAATAQLTNVLSKEASQLRGQIAALHSEITRENRRLLRYRPGSAAANSTQGLIGALQAQQNNASLQLDSVNSQIVQAALSTSSPASQAVVLSRATTSIPPSKLRFAELVALGFVVGVVVAFIIAALVDRRDGRLRRRDDIASAAGAPVLGSLFPVRRHTVPQWSQLFDGFEPDVGQQIRLTRVLRQLSLAAESRARQHLPSWSTALNGANGGTAWDPHHLRNLVVVTLAGDELAQAGIVELAAFIARLGHPIAFGLFGGSGPVSKLERAIEEQRAAGPRQAQNLKLPDPANAGSDDDVLSIALVVLDLSDRRSTFSSMPKLAGDHFGLALLAVSAGFASDRQVSLAAEACSLEHLPLAGVLVAGPEPSDSSTGGLYVPPMLEAAVISQTGQRW